MEDQIGFIFSRRPFFSNRGTLRRKRKAIHPHKFTIVIVVPANPAWLTFSSSFAT